MREIGGRHLFPALLLAGLLHGGLAVAAFWLPVDAGTVGPGVGGLTVSLGSAGGAPGSTAQADPEAVQEDGPPAEAADTPPEELSDAEPPQAVEDVQEVADPTEPPPETILAEQPAPPPPEVQPDPVEAPDPPPEPEVVTADEIDPILEETVEPPPEEEPVLLAESEPVEILEAREPDPVAETPPETQAVETAQPRPPARPAQLNRAAEPPPVPAETPAPAPPVEAPAQPAETAAAREQPPQVAALTAGDAAQVEQDTSGSGTSGAAGAGPNTGIGAAPTAGGNPGVRIDYMTQLAAILSRYKRYPRRAQSRRQQGTGELQFVVDRSGSVMSYSLHRSSGYSLLDKEIMSILGRVGKLPPIPQDMGVAQVEVIVPINFNLR